MGCHGAACLEDEKSSEGRKKWENRLKRIKKIANWKNYILIKLFGPSGFISTTDTFIPFNYKKV